LDAVLLQDAAESEEFSVGGSKTLLEVVHDGAAGGAFLAEFGGEDVDDGALGI
jgi:hypothetical protein